MFTNNMLSDQPFGATLKYIAIGMDANAPIIAALLVVFFQNSQHKKKNECLEKCHPRKLFLAPLSPVLFYFCVLLC